MTTLPETNKTISGHSAEIMSSNWLGSVGSRALVTISRMSADNAIRLRLRTDAGTVDVDMMPADFAACVTGLGDAEARIARVFSRTA